MYPDRFSSPFAPPTYRVRMRVMQFNPLWVKLQKIATFLHGVRRYARSACARGLHLRARCDSSFLNDKGNDILSTNPYSEDLRWRMVWQHLAMGYSYEHVALNLGVDRCTVSGVLQLFHNTETVTKKAIRGKKPLES